MFNTSVRRTLATVPTAAALAFGVFALAGHPVAGATTDAAAPIRLGVLYPETGRSSANYGTADDVARAWADWVNTDLGGIAGHPVEIYAEDGKGDAAESPAAVRALVERDGVAAVLIQDSTAEAAVTEYLAGAGVPAIGGSSLSYNPSWPNIFFPMSTSYPATAASAAFAAGAVGATRFSAAVCSEVPACLSADEVFANAAQQVGIEYVSALTVGAADASYIAPCLELMSNGVDFLHLHISVATSLAVIDECQTQGYEGAFGISMSSFHQAAFDDLAGVTIGGALNGFPWWVDDEPVARFRDVMDTYAPDLDYRDPTSTSTFAALELFRTALDGVSEPEVTSQTIIDAYHQISDESLDGLLARPVTFAEGTEAQPGMQCFWLFEYRDGALTNHVVGESGNGLTTDLASTCLPE